MPRLTFSSPAKINLFLRILGKRPDGYHELASLFQAIDLCDVLHFERAEEDLLTCTDPTLPTDSSNLVLKAAELYRRKTGLKQGFRIHLEKHIPHQAGLGGGSGNAATTLWALNSLCGSIASLQDLTTWSAEIGSDISFFFSQGTAYCTGRGEKLQVMPPVSVPPLWIVKPQEGTSTPAVYKNLDLSSLDHRDPLVALNSFYTPDPHYFNDLEAAACHVLPALASLKDRLLQGGFQEAFLAGSGSSFICIGEATPPAIPGCSTFQVKPLQRQSLNQWYEKA